MLNSKTCIFCLGWIIIFLSRLPIWRVTRMGAWTWEVKLAFVWLGPWGDWWPSVNCWEIKWMGISFGGNVSSLTLDFPPAKGCKGHLLAFTEAFLGLFLYRLDLPWLYWHRNSHDVFSIMPKAPSVMAPSSFLIFVIRVPLFFICLEIY